MEIQHVLVCVTGQKSCQRLIVAGRKIAEEKQTQLSVLHVAKPGNQLLGNIKESEALEYLFHISTEYGAEMMMIRSGDILGTIVAQAGKLNAVTIVTGRASNYTGWDMIDELKSRIPEIPVQIVYT